MPQLNLSAHIPNNYKVMSHIRRGDRYDVCHLWSEKRQCSCIGKMLRPDINNDEIAKKNLLKEGEQLKKLTHPNIVRIYEVYQVPPIIIQETLPGMTLHYMTKKENLSSPLTLKEISYLGLQLCSAVQYLHNNKILHLDLNTSNIICQPPLLKLIDLSISKYFGDIQEKKVGTKQFTSPEQIRKKSLSTATDVWGIGAVLYNVVSGEVPFNKHNINGYEQIEQTITPIEEKRDLPKDFSNLINESLRVNPEDRPEISYITKCLKHFI